MVVELNITEDTAGFVLENVLHQDDTDAIKTAILAKFEKYKTINLYLEEDEVDDIKLSAFIKHALFDIQHGNRFHKIAIVSNRRWIRGVSKVKDLLLSAEVRAYDQAERVKALCWIMKC